MKEFLQRWAINTLAVLVAVYLVRGIHYDKPLDLIVASLVLGVLNAILRPILVAFSISLVIFTLGLFMLVINALLLWLTGSILAPHFTVAGFWPAFWGALTISLVSLVLNVITGTGKSRVRVSRVKPKPDDDKTIDV